MGRPARRLAVAAATAAASLGAVAAPPPVPGSAQDAPAPSLHVLDQAFAVTVGGRWTATIGIDDPADAVPSATTSTATTTTTTLATSTTAAAPPESQPAATPPVAGDEIEARPGRVIVTLGTRLESHRAVTDLYDGVRPRTIAVHTIPLADVLVARSGLDVLAIDLSVANADAAGALVMRRPGLYPITVAIEVDGGVVARVTTVVDRLRLQPADDPPMGLAVTAALDDPGPGASDDELARGRRALEDVVTYASTTEAPLSLALPPDLAPVLESDDALRADVAAALDGADVLALPRPELDPSSAVAIDRVDAFGTNVRRGEDDLARLLPGVAAVRSAWIVTDPISEPAATALRDPLGYRLLVLDQPTYSTLAGNIGGYLDSSLAVDVDLPPTGSLQAAVVHPTGELLAHGADDATAVERAVHVLTDLLVTRRELGPERRRNVVLATGDFSLPDPAAVEALADLAADIPEIELRRLSQLIGTTDPMLVDDEVHSVQLPATAGVDLHDRAESIALMRVAAESAGSMLDGDEQTQAWLAELGDLLSTGYSDAEAEAHFERLRGEINAVRTSVEPPEPFTFTLTGRDSTVRLNLRNTADEPRHVLVRAISPKLRFPDGDVLVTLEPGVNEVTLAVETRANGTSSVEIQVLTPVFGQPVGPSTFLEARVNAVTGLGQLITGAAVLVLVSWWYTHVRRRRRRLAGAPTGAEPGPSISPDAAEVVAGANAGAEDVAPLDDGTVPPSRMGGDRAAG